MFADVRLQSTQIRHSASCSHNLVMIVPVTTMLCGGRQSRLLLLFADSLACCVHIQNPVDFVLSRTTASKTSLQGVHYMDSFKSKMSMLSCVGDRSNSPSKLTTLRFFAALRMAKGPSNVLATAHCNTFSCLF